MVLFFLTLAANLSRLFVAAGFLYMGEAQTVIIKNVRYVR